MLEVPKDVMSEACRDVETSLKNFFDSKSGKRKGPRMAFPNKKKKGKSKDSFRLPGEVLKIIEQKDGKILKIKIGKLGVVKLLEPIDLSSWHLLSFTISRKAGRHFISFCVRRPEKSRIRKVVKPMSIGVDLGVKSLVSYSNKTSKEGPKSLKKALKKLARLQKRASRKYKKGERASKNLERARKKVAALHLKITNVRKDFIEKETTRISRKYDLICVETLNVKGMVRNHKLARSLSDQSFGNFISTLERKQTKYGNLAVLSA
jgi:putative transposase